MTWYHLGSPFTLGVQESWVIVKSSRGYNGGLGYTGGSWEAAGLTPPTKPFEHLAEAIVARDALDKVNAVGWEIWRYREPT